MSVLINGMTMPESCHECVAGYGGCCFVAPAEADGICPDHGRPDFCPLIEIKPHGRLIDADAIEDYLPPPMCELDETYLRLLKNLCKLMPTIIEAEEE